MLQGTDIPYSSFDPLYMHMCNREGYGLGPYVLHYIWNALLLEPEWIINVVSLLLTCAPYILEREEMSFQVTRIFERIYLNHKYIF